MPTEPTQQSSPAVSAEQIAHYYNTNTSHFLRLGGSGNTAAIHRAIWAPGVINKQQAFGYLNALVAQAVQPLPDTAPENVHLLDLGCGVGGTSTWLAQTLGIKVTGITLSAAQVEVARERAQRLGLTEQVDFVLADFAALPEIAPAQAACAIESFVHARDASAFFTMAARHIQPRGRLVICDDFLNPPHSASAQKWIGRFVRGWHLNNLQPVDEVLRLAEMAGFRLLEAHDLSHCVRSFSTPLLWAVTTLTRLPVPWAYWHNLSGGTALQVCLRRGWTKYWALVWERQQS
ncbi:MAG: class I SAM-dependent methyltransferase [Gammaproteobacteria bacterium]|nr:class I SAM-dependent methyltransferase [Gammaproteobacteria bacterium]